MDQVLTGFTSPMLCLYICSGCYLRWYTGHSPESYGSSGYKCQSLEDTLYFSWVYICLFNRFQCSSIRSLHRVERRLSFSSIVWCLLYASSLCGCAADPSNNFHLVQNSLIRRLLVVSPHTTPWSSFWIFCRMPMDGCIVLCFVLPLCWGLIYVLTSVAGAISWEH